MAAKAFNLNIPTPDWSIPLLKPVRYKGAKGGRGSGKSHFFAELLVEAMVIDKDLSAVCIREIQKSLKFSAKKLVEGKISALGVSHLFEVQTNEIKRIGGSGVCIFQGLQDHTADSIKSLEGFKIAWVEEANSLSARSMELLLPTIRTPGSQIWFSWNPDQPDDPVQKMFDDAEAANDPDFAVVHVNFMQNPFCPEETKKEAKRHLKYNPDTYEHVYLGGFNVKNDAKIFNGKWEVDDFEPKPDWEPMYGLDWGFSQDPTTAVECYAANDNLYVRREAGKVGLELDDTADLIEVRIPGIKRHVVRADSARPESISHVKRKGMTQIQPVDKWPGSVEDGIEHMRSYKRIIIHSDCVETQSEFRLYAYKIHKQTGDILPDIVDKHNHYIDAIRYALAPLIKAPPGVGVFAKSRHR